MVEAMNQCPGEGVVGCHDPQAALPTEVAMEEASQQPEEGLVGMTRLRQLHAHGFAHER